jgi:hypothetical protein
MADKEISDLIAADTLDGTELVHVVQSSNSRQSTTQDIADLAAAGAGDVTKVGTPVDDEVAVWTGDGTLEGASGLTYDGSALDITGNITVSGTVDGRDLATDGTKLDGIETSATADQTDAEIRTAVEAATDSNVFTDADHTKLDGIEASADVTDEANVTDALDGATLTDIGTPASGDKILLQDASDSDNLKIATFDEFSGGGGASELDDLSDVTITTPTEDDVLVYNGTAWVNDTVAGTGDMTKAVYDPQAIEGDAFDTDNHTDGTTNKAYTATEQTKLAGIEASADVTDESNVTDALDGATLTDVGTPASGDLVLLQDASDTNILKVAQFSTFGGGSAAFSGALVKKASDQTTANYTTPAAIAFDEESYDEGGWHDNATNNSRFTVPADVTYVRLRAQVLLTAINVGSYTILDFYKNGVIMPLREGIANELSTNFNLTSLVSSVLPCVAGDYFEVFLSVETDTSVTVTANATSFSIEKVA